MRWTKRIKNRKMRRFWIALNSKQRKEYKELLRSETLRKPFRTAVFEYKSVDGITTFTAKPKIEHASKWSISAALYSRENL